GPLSYQPAELGSEPGSIRRGFEYDRVSGSEGGPEFGQVDLVREVPGGDRGDDTHRIATDGPPRGNTHGVCDPEVALPLVLGRRIGHPLHRVDRHVVLRARRQEGRRTGLYGRQGAHRRRMVQQRRMELTQAMDPE